MEKRNILTHIRGLGFRIVKTGIAVTICICIAEWLNLPNPLYIVFTTVLAMGVSIESSFHMVKNYIFGTLCGVLVGGIGAFFMPGNAGVCGIGVIITLYLCSLLRLRGAEVLSCVAFFSMLLTEETISVWRLALNQAGGMFLGLLVALVINLLIMPPNYEGKILQCYSNLKEMITVLMQSKRKQECLLNIEQNIRILQNYIMMYSAEPRFMRDEKGEIKRICELSGSFQKLLGEVESAVRIHEQRMEDEQAQIAYQYHMNQIKKLAVGCFSTVNELK